MADHDNQRSRLVGIFEHGLDEKGRMVLPAKIRARLGEHGMVGMLDGCLGLFTLDQFDRVSDRLLAKAEAAEAPMRIYRRFMMYASEVTPDTQGRVVIPQKLRELARLDSQVVVCGRGDRAEIWAKDRWTEDFDVDADTDDGFDADAAVMAELRI